MCLAARLQYWSTVPRTMISAETEIPLAKKRETTGGCPGQRTLGVKFSTPQLTHIFPLLTFELCVAQGYAFPVLTRCQRFAV